MIYLIEVPHQRNAFLSSFTDEEDIYIYALGHADIDIETQEQSREWITHDLHIGLWIETIADKEEALRYSGHQYLKVRAIAERIDDSDLID